MPTRKDLNLRGDVKAVFTEYLLEAGRRTEAFEFTRDGTLISTCTRNSNGLEQRSCFEPIRRERNRTNVSGANEERLQVSRLDAEEHWWSLDKLHGNMFATSGASSAITRYTVHDIPVETILQSRDGRVLSVIRYSSNEAGQILSATQFGGDVDLLFENSSSAILRPNTELVRCTFQYDAEGRPLEKSVYFVEQLVRKESLTYNEHGDPARVVVEENGPSYSHVYEYEYDAQGNWTRRVLHHSLGTDDVRRTISYYETLLPE